MIRRWGAWIALGVVVVVALAVVLWPNGAQSPAARAHDLETELKCPECQGLSVADSQAPTSRAIRADIKRRIEAGQSDAEIRQAYIDNYGESILLSPAGLRGEPARVDPARRGRSRSGPPASCSRCDATATSRTCTRPRPTSGSWSASAMPERPRPDRLDPERRRELEDERDFLMRSLDDLELEHESGGIDDESYAELHDDYTARAAAVIRTLRDGVDVTPAPPPRSPTRTRRRVVLVSAVVVFAIAAGTSLAYALGARLPGQTASGNSAGGAVDHERGRSALAQKIDDLQDKVNASPDDYQLRLDLARAYEENGDLAERAQAVRRRDHDRRQPARGARERGAAALPRVRGQRRRQGDEAAAGGAGARRASPRRSRCGPDYADATTSAPCCTRSRCATTPRAQVDLQSYLRQGARRHVGRTLARSCSPRSRRRSKPRRLRCHRRPRRGRSSRHGAASRVRDRHGQDLPGDDHHRPRSDRRRPRPEARTEHGEPLRRAVARRASTTASRSTAWSPAS